MVLDNYTPTWLKEDFFNESNPVHCTILQAYKEMKLDGKSEETVLHLGAGKKEVRFSLWGANKARVATQFGDGRNYDTDVLVGRTAKLSRTTNSQGKIINVLEVL